MPGNQQDRQPRLELDQDALNKLLEVQKLNAINDAERINLQKQELAINGKLAEKAIDAQVDLLKTEPSEKRKTMKLVLWFSSFLFIVLLFFFLGCLYLDKLEFAKDFLSTIGYLVSLALAYSFGRMSKKGDNKDDKIPEAEIID